jgi:cyclohexa-1,5-dienecarbonyl-CoA hydratase
MGGAFKDIQFELRDGVGRIVLNRAPLNVLNIAMMEEIQTAIRQAQGAADTRAIVIAAVGRMFSAGVDIAEHTHDLMDRMLQTFHAIFRLMADGEVPTLAVVQGHALGGGCELACFCDLVVAAQDARFGQPEISVGVFPPVAAALFPHLTGGRKAAELILTGEAIPAAEAHRIGLINAVVPAEQLTSEADRLLAGLPTRAPPSSGGQAGPARRDGCRLRPGAARHRGAVHPIADGPGGRRRGLQAFMQKRKPVWRHC